MRDKSQTGTTTTAPSRKYRHNQLMASQPRSHSRRNSRRMLSMMFQGSKPIAARTTPTRIESRIRRNATAGGEPPRKRVRPSEAAGNSLVSFDIVRLPDVTYYGERQMGNH